MDICGCYIWVRVRKNKKLKLEKLFYIQKRFGQNQYNVAPVVYYSFFIVTLILLR